MGLSKRSPDGASAKSGSKKLAPTPDYASLHPGYLLSRESCQCPPGTEGKLACNQGQLCGTLWSADNNVGEMLINEGLAKKYECSVGRCPPKQEWC